MRRWVQLAVLGLFGLLFALNPLAEKLLLPPDLFLKADPLLALSAFCASRRFHESLLYGLPVLLMALVAGRFFCGWLCPLGTLFDLCAGKSKAKKLLCSPQWKLRLLVLLAAASLLGSNLAGLIDPLAFLTRMFTFIAYPLVMLITATGIDVSAAPCRLPAPSHAFACAGSATRIFVHSAHRHAVRRALCPESPVPPVLVPQLLPAGSTARASSHGSVFSGDG